MELEQLEQQFKEELELIIRFEEYVNENVSLMSYGLCAMARDFDGSKVGEEYKKLIKILGKFKLYSDNPHGMYWFYTLEQRLDFLLEIISHLRRSINIEYLTTEKYPHLDKARWAIPAFVSCYTYVPLTKYDLNDWKQLEKILPTLIECYNFPDYKYFMQVFNIKNEISVEIAEWFEENI